MNRILCMAMALMLCALPLAACAEATVTPLAKHGALRVNGTDLVDASGEKYQLYGMSTHGLAWFPQYVNIDAFRTLRDSWNTNCVRLSMYTAENGGYCTGGDQAALKALVCKGVDTATELGMYAIIDWHILRDGDPRTHQDEAIAFFNELSERYADHENVLYEICNEPNGNVKWEHVAEYANAVIPVIRAHSPNAVVLVGTPSWSQEVNRAAKAPLAFDNVMYVLHFYAATHTVSLRDTMTRAIDSGLPVFISEFGICASNGDGSLDYRSAEKWKALIEQYNISYMCWNLANNRESSSVIQPTCDRTSDWSDDELSEQGKWVVEWFRSETNR